MSVLRRSHDHHRDLRARLHAAPSANRSDERDQDRYFMTTAQSRCRKCVRLRRWFSTGRGSARLKYPTVRSNRAPIFVRSTQNLSCPCVASPSANLPDRLVRERHHQPRQSNPHSARSVTARIPSRGFLPWRFSDAGRRCTPHRSSAAGIRKPSQNSDMGHHSIIASSHE